MDKAVFWSGAMAAIAGGLITGLFALGAGAVRGRAETRRQLAQERNVAYAALLTTFDRLLILMVATSSDFRSSEIPPELSATIKESLFAFREAFSTAVMVASPRMIELVHKMSTIFEVINEGLERHDPSELERLRDPLLDLVSQVPQVFSEEARHEVDVASAGWWKQRKLQKQDPADHLHSRLDASLDRMLDEHEVVPRVSSTTYRGESVSLRPLESFSSTVLPDTQSLRPVTTLRSTRRNVVSDFGKRERHHFEEES